MGSDNEFLFGCDFGWWLKCPTIKEWQYLYNSVDIPKSNELCSLKWWILWCVNFKPIKLLLINKRCLSHLSKLNSFGLVKATENINLESTEAYIFQFSLCHNWSSSLILLVYSSVSFCALKCSLYQHDHPARLVIFWDSVGKIIIGRF